MKPEFYNYININCNTTLGRELQGILTSPFGADNSIKSVANVLNALCVELHGKGVIDFSPVFEESGIVVETPNYRISTEPTTEYDYIGNFKDDHNLLIDTYINKNLNKSDQFVFTQNRNYTTGFLILNKKGAQRVIELLKAAVVRMVD